MQNNKKIFLVTLQYRAYVLADNEYDAEDFTRDIVDNERPTTEVKEIHSNVLQWPQYACVYHADQFKHDIKIADIFPVQ